MKHDTNSEPQRELAVFINVDTKPCFDDPRFEINVSLVEIVNDPHGARVSYKAISSYSEPYRLGDLLVRRSWMKTDYASETHGYTHIGMSTGGQLELRELEQCVKVLKTLERGREKYTAKFGAPTGILQEICILAQTFGAKVVCWRREHNPAVDDRYISPNSDLLLQWSEPAKCEMAWQYRLQKWVESNKVALANAA